MACDGTLERNHDGIHEVICTAYHLPNGNVADVFCEACDAILCPECRAKECPMSEYGIRYSACDDCAGDREPDYQAVTMQEQYERAYEITHKIKSL